MAVSSDPAFEALDRITLGHLWWTLHLASSLVTSLRTLSPSDPAYLAALADLESALTTTAPLHQAIFDALRVQVMPPAPAFELWD